MVLIGRQVNHRSHTCRRTLAVMKLHCASKNDTDVAHYNFKTHQPILVIFGRDVAETVCYHTVICCPTSPS